MLRSFVSFAARGELILRREILYQLGIGPNGVLYGALYPSENTLIMSPIPREFWDSALKIIIHTEHIPGSLAKAADAIADLQLNTISSWASCESWDGHLCSTSIVVAEKKLVNELGGVEGISKALKVLLKDNLSKLSTFGTNLLDPVRVTPLSILNAYAQNLDKSQFEKIHVLHHSLNLDSSENNIESKKNNTLWSRLMKASELADASACILTTDTEEAFIRISAIPQAARFCRLSFRLLIKSESDSFTGYWKHALNLIAENKYSIFVAHNLIITKSETDHTEEAEFNFIADRKNSPDTGLSFEQLKNIWCERLQLSFTELVSSKGDTFEIKGLRLSRPRGVGVPCFFASNAKPGDGLGAKTAEEICRRLESQGFKPVNIDLAQGGPNLRDQVTNLVHSCHFMVVLHCPEEKLKNLNGEYRVSEWVSFEEGLMAAQHGEIHRLRFANVVPPSFDLGFFEVTLPAEGITEVIFEEFIKRLQRWTALMYAFDNDYIFAPEIPIEHLERDLVAYYAGK